MGVKILWCGLLAIWFVLVLIGKGGFIHLLLLNGFSIMMIDLVSSLRARITLANENDPSD